MEMTLSRVNVSVVDYFKYAVIFSPILLYSPFVFVEIASVVVKVTLLLLLTTYLFLKSSRFSKNDLMILILLFLRVVSLIAVNSSGLLGLRGIGSSSLILVFAWAFHRYLWGSRLRGEMLVSLYIKFFLLIPIFASLSVLFMLAFGEWDLFSLHSEMYNYFITPFGITIPKEFNFFNVYRSFFFFTEPVYLAIFYAANIFVVAPYLGKKSRLFVASNFVGGILTWSYFFAISLPLLYVVKNFKFSLRTLLLVIFMIFMIFIVVILGEYDFFEMSSLSQRQLRMNLFIEIAERSNVIQLIFGHGFYVDTNVDFGFSSGILTSIYEIGIFNIVITMLIAILLSQSITMVIVFTLAMLVFEPNKQPLFWMLISLASYVSINEVRYQFRMKNLQVKNIPNR
jgi:hypothetical protein